MVKYLSFHNSSSFASRYFFNVNGDGQHVPLQVPLKVETGKAKCPLS